MQRRDRQRVTPHPNLDEHAPPQVAYPALITQPMPPWLSPQPVRDCTFAVVFLDARTQKTASTKLYTLSPFFPRCFLGSHHQGAGCLNGRLASTLPIMKKISHLGVNHRVPLDFASAFVRQEPPFPPRRLCRAFVEHSAFPSLESRKAQ